MTRRLSLSHFAFAPRYLIPRTSHCSHVLLGNSSTSFLSPSLDLVRSPCFVYSPPSLHRPTTSLHRGTCSLVETFCFSNVPLSHWFALSTATVSIRLVALFDVFHGFGLSILKHVPGEKQYPIIPSNYDHYRRCA